MMRSMRAALALCIGAGAVAACSGKAANGNADHPPPAATAAATAAAHSSAPAGGTADTAAAAPKVTPFTHGEASLTLGTPMKFKLKSGKLVETSPLSGTDMTAQMADVESIFLEYTTDGKTYDNGLFDFNAGRHKTGGYNMADMRVNSHGFWRINNTPAVRCTIAMSEVGASGLRGTITCTGDPKGPTGPITFTATP
jgi:hypothetical protein